MKNYSVIFDLDGVIIDSNPFHKNSWKLFCEKHGLSLSDEILEKKIFGRPGNEAIPILFNKQIEDDIVKAYTEEVDDIFRKSFAQFIQPVEGLVKFLISLKLERITAAIATSAPTKNVEFVMNKTRLQEYFKAIVDNTFISKGKPNPEIYLTTAKIINQDPQRCIVIEDSFSGIEAAISAGMKVIGITTTHTKEELAHTDYVINDFNDLKTSILDSLFED